jgi:hypothetical protein
MKYTLKLLSFVIALALLFSSCTKKTTTTSGANTTISEHSQDVSNSTTESSNVNNDVNNALTNVSGFGKNFSIQALTICGASIDSSHNTGSQPYIIITYNGSSVCSSTEVRSGQVKVQLISGAAYTDANAVLELTFTNYKVVYPLLDNHYLIFNGTKYLTDVNGIDWLTVYLGTSTVTLRERSYNMEVTFDNGQTSSWNSARLSTYGMTNFTAVYGTINGDTTIGGKTIDSWGKTRFNTNFTTQMIQPWQSGTTCGWWAPTSGNYTSVTDSFTVSALLGVNSAGNQVSSGCAWGLKLNWTLNPGNYTGEALVQYW